MAAAAGELCCSRSNERLPRPQREYHTLLFEMSRETFKSKDMCLSRLQSGGKRVVAAAVVGAAEAGSWGCCWAGTPIMDTEMPCGVMW